MFAEFVGAADRLFFSAYKRLRLRLKCICEN